MINSNNAYEKTIEITQEILDQYEDKKNVSHYVLNYAQTIIWLLNVFESEKAYNKGLEKLIELKDGKIRFEDFVKYKEQNDKDTNEIRENNSNKDELKELLPEKFIELAETNQYQVKIDYMKKLLKEVSQKYNSEIEDKTVVQNINNFVGDTYGYLHAMLDYENKDKISNFWDKNQMELNYIQQIDIIEHILKDRKYVDEIIEIYKTTGRNTGEVLYKLNLN